MEMLKETEEMPYLVGLHHALECSSLVYSSLGHERSGHELFGVNRVVEKKNSVIPAPSSRVVRVTLRGCNLSRRCFDGSWFVYGDPRTPHGHQSVRMELPCACQRRYRFLAYSPIERKWGDAESICDCQEGRN